jgi:hypothetical protein
MWVVGLGRCELSDLHYVIIYHKQSIIPLNIIAQTIKDFINMSFALQSTTPPFNTYTTLQSSHSIVHSQSVSMPSSSRSEATREIERASRHRRQDAMAELMQVLRTIPRHILQQLLSLVDPNAVLPRRGIPEAHAIKIAIALIM